MFFIFFMCFIFIFGTVLNLLILVVYRPNTKYYASLFLLVSLASVNLFSSFVVVPYTAVIVLGSPFFCGLNYFLRVFIHSITTCILILVGYERLSKLSDLSRSNVANKSSNKNNAHLAYNSKKAFACSCVICFGLSVVNFHLHEDGEFKCTCNKTDIYNKYYIIISVLLGLSFFALLIMYVKTFMIYHASSNRIFTNITINSIENNNSPILNMTNILIKKEWKIAKIFISVNLKFGIIDFKNFFNFNIFNFVKVTIISMLTWVSWAATQFRYNDRNMNDMNDFLILSNVYFLNSVLNPGLYLIYSKSFRRDFFLLVTSILMCFFKKK